MEWCQLVIEQNSRNSQHHRITDWILDANYECLHALWVSYHLAAFLQWSFFSWQLDLCVVIVEINGPQHATSWSWHCFCFLGDVWSTCYCEWHLICSTSSLCYICSELVEKWPKCLVKWWWNYVSFSSCYCFADSSSKIQEYADRPRLDECLAISTHLQVVSSAICRQAGLRGSKNVFPFCQYSVVKILVKTLSFHAVNFTF